MDRIESISDHLTHLASRGFAVSTIRTYRWRLTRFIRWLGDREISAAAVREHLAELQADGIRPRTIHVTLAVIRGYVDWLGATGLADPITLDAGAGVRAPRLDAVQRTTPTDAQASALLAAPERRPGLTLRQRYDRGRAQVVVYLLLHAALRRSELLGLDLADVEGDQVRVRCGKGGHSRHVPQTAGLRQVLANWRVVRSEWCCARGIESDALIPIDRARRLSINGVTSVWREVTEWAGIDGSAITPHSCRHWCASRVARAVDAATAQRMLGHRHISTTYQYLRSDEDLLCLAVQALDAMATYRPTPALLDPPELTVVQPRQRVTPPVIDRWKAMI